VKFIYFVALQMKGFFAVEMHLVEVLTVLDTHLADFLFVLILLKFHLVF
jgi:hypothetical protein